MILHEKEMFRTVIGSPLGPVEIRTDGQFVISVTYQDHEGITDELPCPVLKMAVAQLREYFTGKRKEFDIPVRPSGSVFEGKVWEQIMEIPYGVTISYGTLAKRIGMPRSARAVGRANGRNPVAIIIPCHRVVGANGSLTGYSGGLWRKEWLIRHEAAIRGGIVQSTLF